MSAKDNLLRVIRHDHPQWVPEGMESVIFISPPLVTRPRFAGLDAWNVAWEDSHTDTGTYPRQGEHVITDVRAWHRQMRLPDVSSLDWSKFPAGWGGHNPPVAIHEIERREHLLCGVVELSLFERSYLLMGMEQALISYMTDTDAVDALLEAITDFNIGLIRRFDDEVHLDMIWYGDDWGTQRGLFIPPAIWRRTIGRHTRRVYACMKERGIIINQHSCGKIDSVLEDIVKMGADMWNPCQPCNDLAEMKRRFGGRITFCGGIDSQFVLDRPGVTPEEVRAEVRKRIDMLAAGGGYIAEPSHAVPYRREIMEAMRDEISTYGKTYYSRATVGRKSQ